MQCLQMESPRCGFGGQTLSSGQLLRLVEDCLLRARHLNRMCSLPASQSIDNMFLEAKALSEAVVLSSPPPLITRKRKLEEADGDDSDKDYDKEAHKEEQFTAYFRTQLVPKLAGSSSFSSSSSSSSPASAPSPTESELLNESVLVTHELSGVCDASVQVVVGLKKTRFRPTDVFQAKSFGEQVLRSQPGRRSLSVALCNCSDIQILRFTRSWEGVLSTTQTEALPLRELEGQNLLLALLHSHRLP